MVDNLAKLEKAYSKDCGCQLDLERRRAAGLIRDFLCGKITNFEFEDCWPKSDDEILESAFRDLWRFYDDYPESHFEIGRLAFFERKRAVRWIRLLGGKNDAVE